MDNGIIKLPYEIDSDSEYKKAFVKCMDKYISWAIDFLQRNEGFTKYLSEDEKDGIIKAIVTDGGIIKNCIKLYCSGDIVSASLRIKRLLSRIIEEDKGTGFIKSDLDKNYCSRMSANYPFLYGEEKKRYIERLLEHNLTFFRARTDYFLDYKEMYHIPLDKRDLVDTERFSVPGIPCFYMGSSIYDIWLEMGRPAYSDFNVSAIKLTESGKKLQILNLTANPYLLLGVNNISGNEDEIENNVSLVRALLRIYPLVIATSIRNKSPRGKFRSDYIISHLIMMSIKDLGIDGVAYLSKRIENYGEDYAMPQLVNIALPAFEESKINKKYGTICEKIEITRAANYEEFLSLELGAGERNDKASYFAKTFVEPGYHNIANGIVVSGRYVDYHDTGFYRFENHVCSMKFHELTNS